MGTPGGGVWKTDRRRHRLEPDLRSGSDADSSIGAIQVA
jgi:hypothetical protein